MEASAARRLEASADMSHVADLVQADTQPYEGECDDGVARHWSVSVWISQDHAAYHVRCSLLCSLCRYYVGSPIQGAEGTEESKPPEGAVEEPHDNDDIADLAPATRADSAGEPPYLEILDASDGDESDIGMRHPLSPDRTRAVSLSL